MEMVNFEEAIDELNREGVYYYGEPKKYCGKIPTIGKYCFLPNDIPDICGYYENYNKKWISFITNRRSSKIWECVTESECSAIQTLSELANIHNHIYFDKKPIVIEYLIQEYNYTQEKAEDIVKWFFPELQLFDEFFHYIQDKHFVSDETAFRVRNYTVKMFYETTALNIVDAFCYVVYLAKHEHVVSSFLSLNKSCDDILVAIPPQQQVYFYKDYDAHVIEFGRYCVGEVDKGFREMECSIWSAFGYYKDTDGFHVFHNTSEKGGYIDLPSKPCTQQEAITTVLSMIESEYLWAKDRKSDS